MRDFNRNYKSDHDRPFGRKKQFGNRFDRPMTTMYDAVCSNCGKSCQVPFRPTGTKPVLCRDCFREAGGNSRRDEGNFQRPNFQQNNAPQNNELKTQLDALTRKVDKILTILEAAVNGEETKKTKEPEETKGKEVETTVEEAAEAVETPAPKKKRKTASKK